VVGEQWNSQILVNLPVTSVPSCTGSNAKTLGLKHLHLPDMAAGGGPPDGARVGHHWTDELLIQQNSVPDGEKNAMNKWMLYYIGDGVGGDWSSGKVKSQSGCWSNFRVFCQMS
jgi:hypothetical protein